MSAAESRWIEARPQIVFEDAHLRVMFQPGGSDMLLLSFGDAVILADGTKFFAEPVVRKFGLNCLGFMARAPNWYPADSMRAAARAVAYTLAAFDIRIAYGSSMGAYGAIKYSALLGITHVVAFCPQWSIDPAECGGNESGYRDFFRPEMAGLGVTAADMAGEITVFYDPRQPNDAYHYRALAALSPRVRACRVHHAGHHLAPVLRGSSLAVALFAACYHGDAARLYALVNPPRRASVHRRRNLLAAAAARHPRLTLAALRQVIRAGQTEDMDAAQLFRALRDGGQPDLAEQLLALLMSVLSKGRSNLLRSGAALMPERLLRTAHDTVLCYSALGGCLVHVGWPAGNREMPGLQPVQIRNALLAIVTSGRTYFCQGRDVLATELVPAGPGVPAGAFEAVPAGEGLFHLRSSATYATAQRDGTIWRAATAPREWELYEAIAADRVCPRDGA